MKNLFKYYNNNLTFLNLFFLLYLSACSDLGVLVDVAIQSDDQIQNSFNNNNIKHRIFVNTVRCMNKTFYVFITIIW